MSFLIRSRLRSKQGKITLAAESAFYFTSNPQNFFSTILIGNNIINITFASVSALFLTYCNFGLDELSILVISTFALFLSSVS
jgi:putative hemolysin